MPVLPSYKNQFIDLDSKSIDWFLNEGNTGLIKDQAVLEDDITPFQQRL